MGPRQIVRGALAALACVCAVLAMPAGSACGSAPRAPLVQAQGDMPVPEHYMVMLKPGVSSAAFLAHRAAVAQFVLASIPGVSSDANFGFRHIYDMDSHLQGYAGRFSPAMLQYIRAQPEVDYVEVDSIVRATVLEQDDRYVSEMPPAATAQTMPWDDPLRHLTEDGAPWGLARISHRRSLSLGTFNKYVYESAAGDGVTAYIIDTGIRVDHEDFGGRARWGTTIPEGDTDEDGHGHGTHCAGTIGSTTYGVAKNAELVAVKVLNSEGQGAMSDVTAGVLWAVADAQERTRRMRARPWLPAARKHRGFVASMSLGGAKSPTLERAVNGAVSVGMHFAVAAVRSVESRLTPAQLRRAMRSMATAGALTDLDPDTINKLAYNNATSVAL